MVYKNYIKVISSNLLIFAQYSFFVIFYFEKNNITRPTTITKDLNTVLILKCSLLPNNILLNNMVNKDSDAAIEFAILTGDNCNATKKL